MSSIDSTIACTTTTMNINSTVVWWTHVRGMRLNPCPIRRLTVGFTYDVFKTILVEEDDRMDMIMDLSMENDYVWVSVHVDEDFRFTTKSLSGDEEEYRIVTMFEIMDHTARIVDAKFSLDVMVDGDGMKLLRMTIINATDKGPTHISMNRTMK